MGPNGPSYPVLPNISSEQKCKQQPLAFPPQHQERQPGVEWAMQPRPIYQWEGYRGAAKLQGRVAIITGGDSGIGRAVAVAFAKEGADVTIAYLYEHEDAAETARAVEQAGRRCLALAGDLRNPAFSNEVVARTVDTFGRLDVVVNNAAVQFPRQSLLAISDEQLEETFRTNIFPVFYITRAALPHLKHGSSIISTASITAYRGEPTLVDYASTKGAIVAFTRSLAKQLAGDGIRVNAVAPGPVWTPLIVSSFPADRVTTFGTDTPLGRAAQPFELAPAYVYLASDDSAYATGQVLHVDGGAYRSS